MSDAESRSTTQRRSNRLTAAEFNPWPDEKLIATLADHGVNPEPGLSHSQLINLLVSTLESAEPLSADLQSADQQLDQEPAGGSSPSRPRGKAKAKKKNTTPQRSAAAARSRNHSGAAVASSVPSDVGGTSLPPSSAAILMTAMTTLMNAVGALGSRLKHQEPAAVPGSSDSLSSVPTLLPVAANSSASPPVPKPGFTLSSAQAVSNPGNQFISPFACVSPKVRSQIVQGKDVNLASLILPNPVCDKQLVGNDQFPAVIRSSDPRTLRTLDLCDFVLAFGIYRDILCEVFPDRRQELDTYLSLICELKRRYGGTIYYDYHKAFSAKSATFISRFNTRLDWSCLDTELLILHVGGHRALTCQMCNQVGHSVDACPKSVFPAAPLNWSCHDSRC